MPCHAVPCCALLLTSQASLHRPVVPNEIETAVLALHMRRVNVLEFHPVRDDVLLSGDKVGYG